MNESTSLVVVGEQPTEVVAGMLGSDIVSRLTVTELQEAQEISAAVDISDTTSIIGFGADAQRVLTVQADDLLRGVRAKDIEPASEGLTDLLVHVKNMGVDSLSSPNILSRLPVIGTVFNAGRRFLVRYEQIGHQIEGIVAKLEEQRADMLDDVVRLDMMFAANEESLQQLLIYIGAGELALDRLAGELQEIQRQAEESGDFLDAQKVRGLQDMISHFEQRIHDLRLTALMAIQMAPQIRIVQRGDIALIAGIQSSIVTTLPLWKANLSMAVVLYRQRETLGLQQRITATTNKLLEESATVARENAVAIATETERSVVSIKALEAVNRDLIATVEETVAIQQQGRARRAEVELRLAELEGDLRVALSGAKKLIE